MQNGQIACTADCVYSDGLPDKKIGGLLAIERQTLRIELHRSRYVCLCLSPSTPQTRRPAVQPVRSAMPASSQVICAPLWLRAAVGPAAAALLRASKKAKSLTPHPESDTASIKTETGPSFDFDLSDANVQIQGTRLLEYFVGSGTVGRSYLFSIDRFCVPGPRVLLLRESKVGTFRRGYQNYDRLLLTRPVEPACLRCHASRLQPLAGTLNGFADPAFLEGGIGCERCHGSGEEHVAKNKDRQDRGRTRRREPAEIVAGTPR